MGWEVWLDGMEITQFTYFQQVGSIDIKPVAVEITYGLERLAMYIQGVENVYDLQWVGDVTYGDVFHTNEVEQSRYSFDIADIDLLFDLFDKYEKEAKRVILTGNIRPAYDYVLKCSHTFNHADGVAVLLECLVVFQSLGMGHSTHIGYALQFLEYGTLRRPRQSARPGGSYDAAASDLPLHRPDAGGGLRHVAGVRPARAGAEGRAHLRVGLVFGAAPAAEHRPRR